MIDLAFGESAAGALKVARRSALGRIGSEVLPLTLALDVGDLSDAEALDEGRLNTLLRLYGRYPGVAETLSEQNLRTASRLKQAFSEGEAVRMWLCPCDPAELCGLLWVCALAGELPARLSAVAVPTLREERDSIALIRSTGELEPERFAALAELERPVSPAVRRACAQRWRELTAENAPLRAVVNGRLAGVPEDFYDFALLKFLPEGEFVVAEVLGKALAMLPGVSDCWLYLRLSAMRERGLLAEVRPAEGDHPYSGVWKSLRRSAR